MPRKQSPVRSTADQGSSAVDQAVENVDADDAPDPSNATPQQARRLNNRSVERVVSVLNLLQEAQGPLSLVEIHHSVNMAKATLLRYLWTLQKHRYVERDPDGRYRLGLGFVGMQSRDLDVLKERARPWLETLRDDTGETSNLGILDGNAIRYVEVAESTRSVRMSSQRGSREPIYCTALGKAITAQMPEEQVRELLGEEELVPRTASTITSIEDYLTELESVRKHGYAIDDRETDVDGRCVAVAILGSRLPAALSVSGPASRFTIYDVHRVAKSLIETAERIAADPGTRPASNEPDS